MENHIINDVKFTKTEVKILACFACHVTRSKIIGSILGSSPKTVNNHTDNIKRKINVNNKDDIVLFVRKSKQVNQLKDSFNKRYIDYKYTKTAKNIAHNLALLNVQCICSVNPKLIENAEVDEICQAIKLVNIKLEIVNNVQSLLDSLAILSATKLGLFIVNDIDEIKNLRKHINSGSNNIIYICLNKQQNQPEFSNVLFYDKDNKKEFYHFLIKYFIKKYPEINRLNKELDFLSAVDNIDNSTNASDEIDIPVSSKLNIFSTKNLWIALGIICLGVIIWYASALPKKQDQVIGASTSSLKAEKISDMLVYNLPSRNIQFTGRNDLFKKIKTNLNKIKTGIVTQAVVGSGGIGKTQFLTEYAYRAMENKEYDAILWINANTSNSVDNSYEDIANRLGINIVNMNSSSIKRHVHSELLDKRGVKKILFVLDNAPKSKDIKSYITSLRKQWPINAKVHILISSRSQHWAGSTLILDVFTEKEAKAFVKKSLPYAKEQDILRLIKTFNYYPLALGQAIGYIKQHTSIGDYIELYTNKKQQYLNKFVDNASEYSETLWNILSLSLSKLGDDAKEILYMSSYLDPDKIQLDIFDMPIENRVGAVKELREHSIIAVVDHGEAFRIHSLLQEIIRLKIKDQPQWYSRMVILAKQSVEHFDINNKDTWHKAKEWLFHINSLYSYMDKTLNTADLLDKYGVVAQHFGLYDLAYEVFSNSLQIQENIYKNSKHIGLINTLSILGKLELERGNYANSKKFYQEVLEIKENYYKDPNHIEFSKSLNNLGAVKLKLGLYNVAKSLYKRSLKIQKLYYNDISHIELADTLLGLGMVERYFGYYKEAGELFRQAFEIKKIYYKDPEHIEISGIFLQIGVIEFYLRNIQEAKNIFEKVLRIQENVYKEDSIFIFYALQGLGVLEWEFGNYNKAKRIFQRALKINTMHYENPEFISSSLSLQGLGLVEFGMGNYKEARDLLEKELSIKRTHYKSSHHASLGDSLYTLAMVNELLGNYDLALNYMNQAYEVLHTHYGERLPKILVIDFTPVLSLPILKPINKVEIIKYYIKSLEITKKIFGAKYNLVSRYYFLLGQAYALNGQNTKAIEQYKQALTIAKEVASNIKEKMIFTKYQENVKKIESRLNKLIG